MASSQEFSHEFRDVAIGPITLVRDFFFQDYDTPNPGIGGTEFQAILTAIVLAKAGLKVDLICIGGEARSDCFRTINLNGTRTVKYDIQISPLSAISNPALETLVSKHKVAVSHHPHDLTRSKRRLLQGWDLLVSVGEYQYWSNWLSPIPHIWIPGFAKAPFENTLSESIQEFVVGHISSLHPSKGFHVLAQAWPRVARRAEDVRLEVVGGLRLYGEPNENLDTEIPTTHRYSGKIKRILGGQVPGEVEFLGVLNGSQLADKMQTWAVAVLNPLGTGEADPGVVRDCWSLGIPVISTMHFGMGDYQTHFPELVASSPGKISKLILRLHARPSKLLSLRERTKEVYGFVWARSQYCQKLWVQIAKELASNGDIEGLSSKLLKTRDKKMIDGIRLIYGWTITLMLRLISSIRGKQTQNRAPQAT
jgi:glycosyltransferase involved in cell wall biosynthesis